MKHHFSPYNRNFSSIPGLKQKIPFIQKIIFIKIKIFKFSSGDETSHIIVKMLSWDKKSPYNLSLDLITNCDQISIITIRWAVDILKIGTILAKKFKLFLLGSFWRQAFFNKYRFYFFLLNSITKSCYIMINWKNLFWMSTINASSEKGLYLRYVAIFLFSIL